MVERLKNIDMKIDKQLVKTFYIVQKESDNSYHIGFVDSETELNGDGYTIIDTFTDENTYNNKLTELGIEIVN